MANVPSSRASSKTTPELPSPPNVAESSYKLDQIRARQGERILEDKSDTQEEPKETDEETSTRTKNIQERVANISKELTVGRQKEKSITSVAHVITERIRNKYKHLDVIGTGRIQTLDWNDGILRVLDHIDLSAWFRYDNASRQKLLLVALGSLHSEVSAQSVGTILVCAYGVRSCENVSNYLFKGKVPRMDGDALPVTSLENRTVFTNIDDDDSQDYKLATPINYEMDSWKMWERSATYICMSLLRLVVKEETNIKNAWEYIRTQYKNFYQEDILIDLNPNLGCLSAIRQIMQSRTVIKNTVGVFLLAYTELEGQDAGMCRMLYALQMSYTGMHSYSLLLSCADKLGMPLHILVSLLEHPMTSSALETIASILTTYEFPQSAAAIEKAKSAKTWRFARVFEPTAFANLQTKNCMMLTSVLALVSQKLGTRGAGDVTKIRQIAGFADNQREFLEDTAQNILEYCMGGAWAPSDMVSGVFTHKRRG